MPATALSAIAIPLTDKSEFRILPASRFKAVDGRPSGGMWVMNAAIGAKLVSEANSRKIDYVIDYEHQTLLANTNGKPAPAAGWFKNLAWRDDGLYVTDTRWTAAAKAMLDAEQYRFISPAFLFDKKTFEVTGLLNIALTNSPALHGLTDLALLKLTNPLMQGGQQPNLTAKDREIFKSVFGMDTDALASTGAMQANVVEPVMTDRSLEALVKMFHYAG
ncbi:phage protease [Rhodoferax sp.]|uniref:phage protease n=1 Tax=Rhodoferax sp. TaxID=50421 RepID=UPI0025D98187|nr:phage protease [Rhodoferax sp.]